MRAEIPNPHGLESLRPRSYRFLSIGGYDGTGNRVVAH